MVPTYQREALRQARWRSLITDAYCDWLASFRWRWFLTLTFREPTTSRQALRAFDKWINEVQRYEATPNFRYVRVLQFGAYGENLHFHVLLGGLRPRCRVRLIVRRWYLIAGWPEVTRFRPDRAAFHYILRDLRPDSEPDTVDFFGITGPGAGAEQ